MAHSTPREGFIPVTGGRVWYQIAGSNNSIPLLTLHGGPGAPHDYLEPLAGLADERPVIFYDQLGCGKSDRPDDVSLWRTERFVEELSEVRRVLGLEKVHLLGQSWGTMLAVEYMLTQPSGVESLILASPCLNLPGKHMLEAQRLLAALPEEVQAIIHQHEAAGTTDSEEYQQAAGEFYARHLCRISPLPESLQRSMAGMGHAVYATMWGASEFSCTGLLKDFDRTDRLHEINVPTLFTCGRYDECTPEATLWFHKHMPNSEMVVFEQSSHMAQLEETGAYLQTIRAFLQRAEERHKA